MPDPIPEPTTLCVPVKLDAFVFNEHVCDPIEPDKSKIGPIIQPDYTFLRVKDSLALHDVLPHVDLHNSAPGTMNSRLTDLGSMKTRSKRLGVYLHWVIPRPFRRGVASTHSAPAAGTASLRALATPEGETLPKDGNGSTLEEDHSAPVFLPIPNRWMVIRRLDPEAETTVPRYAPIERVKAWVIESDRTRYIDEIDGDVDLQVDVSPFLTSFGKDDTPGSISIDKQAEVFIGQCFDAEKWSEDASVDIRRTELNAASSSNQLFMDYQYHCGNVFSMLDTFSYIENKEQKQLKAAHVSYYVVMTLRARAD
jgi:hypothetical protein